MDNATSGTVPLEQTRLTGILADFVATTPASKIPKAALENARYLILDTIGVSIACSTHSVGKIISDHVVAINGKDKSASVFGKRKIKVAPPLAAMANGTLSNSLDYDGGGHIVTHLLPAVLAIAESKGLSGKDALTATLKKIIVQNTADVSYGDRWATFEGGVLTLDHKPTTNVDSVKERTDGLVALLEKSL